jgi:secondary thiamine-phosphate synthase enzyme
MQLVLISSLTLVLVFYIKYALQPQQIKQEMVWKQVVISLTAPKRGMYLVTDKVMNQISKEISGIKIGICNLFIQHTSAALTINENYDSDVRKDMEDSLNYIVPENQKYYRHTTEGKDDMPAHVKASLFGPSVSIPITNGKLNLGTWQGIWLCEFRDNPSTRNIVVTINGE